MSPGRARAGRWEPNSPLKALMAPFRCASASAASVGAPAGPGGAVRRRGTPIGGAPRWHRRRISDGPAAKRRAGLARVQHHLSRGPTGPKKAECVRSTQGCPILEKNHRDRRDSSSARSAPEARPQANSHPCDWPSFLWLACLMGTVKLASYAVAQPASLCDLPPVELPHTDASGRNA